MQLFKWRQDNWWVADFCLFNYYAKQRCIHAHVCLFTIIFFSNFKKKIKNTMSLCHFYFAYYFLVCIFCLFLHIKNIFFLLYITICFKLFIIFCVPTNVLRVPILFLKQFIFISNFHFYFLFVVVDDDIKKIRKSSFYFSHFFLIFAWLRNEKRFYTKLNYSKINYLILHIAHWKNPSITGFS